MKEQEQHNNCMTNWTLEKAKRLSIGLQNLETLQPKITTKLLCESARRTLLLNTQENISQWADYFMHLLNKARQHIEGRDEPLTEGPLHEVTWEEVERHLNKMKKGKKCGPDGIPTEALKHLGDWGVRNLTKIFNAILQSGKMPDEWRESTITPIYKDKGDHVNCSNYRGIKLLSPTVKLWERVIDQRLRDIASISDGQFGFKSGSEPRMPYLSSGPCVRNTGRAIRL